MRQKDTYGEPIVQVLPNGVIVKVYRPILTEEEYERRMKLLMEETERFMRAVFEQEEKKKREKEKS